MLDTIKEKLKAVKNELTENFRAHFQQSNAFNIKFGSEVHCPFTNVNAGQEILNHYESSWHAIRSLTNQNASRAADDVTKNLHNLRSLASDGAEKYKQINNELSTTLPQLSDQLNNIIAETVKLQGLCEEVESSLFYLELLCQTQDMEHIKLEQRFQLAMYREKKLAAFNDTKRRLSNDFLKRKQEKEEIHKQNLLEKQKILQQAAEKDLEIYKNTGHITNSLLEDYDQFQRESSIMDTSITELLQNQMNHHKLATQLTYDVDHERDIVDTQRDTVDPQRDIVDLERDTIDPSRDVVDPSRDIQSVSKLPEHRKKGGYPPRESPRVFSLFFYKKARKRKNKSKIKLADQPAFTTGRH